jgi:3-dehydroquinate synthase
MVDAGIGVKNGINFEGAKSLLGSFAACEACLIDPTFLDTLPRRYLRCGLAECVKVAIVSSPKLFDLLDLEAQGLLDEAGRTLPGAIDAVIRLSAEWTLDELELNLFERKELFSRAYTRKLDFGHTFSPHIEAASQHGLLHGEAVAIDMAISAEIACRLGVLDEATRTRIVDLLCQLGLPIHWQPLDPEALHASLKSVVLHRDGMLNLVVPRGIGEVAFIEKLEGVSVDLIREVVRRLEAWGTQEARRWQAA